MYSITGLLATAFSVSVQNLSAFRITSYERHFYSPSITIRGGNAQRNSVLAPVPDVFRSKENNGYPANKKPLVCLKHSSIREEDPYELVIDSLIKDDASDKASFIDGLTVSDLLIEVLGAESVVTTKAPQSNHAEKERKEEDIEDSNILRNLLLDPANKQKPTVSNDIFDEPDVDYSKELAETVGSVPNQSLNIGKSDANEKNTTRPKKTRKVWSHSQIVARMPPYSQTFVEPSSLINILEDNLQLPATQSLQYEIRVLNEKEEETIDWCKEVQKTWPPSLLSDDVVVSLPFHTHEDCAKVIMANNPTRSTSFDKIIIEGGSAFGTGDHPTSRMCSEWLLKECSNISNDITRLDVMDYGSGSGILSFVALLAAKRENNLDKIRVDGVDVDAVAIESARRNAVLNGFRVETDITKHGVQFYGPMEGTPGSELWDDLTGVTSTNPGNAERCEGDEKIDLLPSSRIGSYDILIANILAQPLISLVKTIAMLVKPSTGRLALSGLISDQVEYVIEAYAPFFDNLEITEETNGWVLLQGTRNEIPSGHPLDS